MRRMSRVGSVTFVVIALGIFGCDLIKKDGGDAGAADTTAAAAGLPPTCETFLTRYSCFLTKNAKPTTEADDMRRDWTKSLVAAPATRGTIEATCKTQLEAQSAQFTKAGCTTASTAAATATTTASAVPVKSATAAPTPVASVAKKKPNLPTCKSNEALVTWAMSPLVPECAPKCATDADCKAGHKCFQLSLIGPDGMPASQSAKTCFDPNTQR